jgi:hypothetical protein
MESVQPEREQRTTINVNRGFADVVTDLAGDSELAVRDYCDRHILPLLRPLHATYLRRKLAEHEAETAGVPVLGGES